VTELPVRVLSLWAPWCWAILHAGKDIENRMRSFPRSFVGEFWLHASLWPGTRKPLSRGKQEELIEQFQAALAMSGKPRDAFPPLTLGDLDGMRGKIVGRVTVTGYVEESASPWFVPGSLGLQLTRPHALREPVSAVGAQGWWFATPDEMQQLRDAAKPQQTQGSSG